MIYLIRLHNLKDEAIPSGYCTSWHMPGTDQALTGVLFLPSPIQGGGRTENALLVPLVPDLWGTLGPMASLDAVEDHIITVPATIRAVYDNSLVAGKYKLALGLKEILR